MTRPSAVDFKLPALLLALSVVPVLGGVARLRSLAAGVPAADEVRFLAAPFPVLIHVIAATLYALLGAFQFSTGIRRRWPRWHRRAGVLLLGCGFLVGATGVWMTAVYAIPPALQGPLLYGARLLVGVAMLASITKGLASILRRDIAEHEAWMIRAYALAQGAGTQAVIVLPLILLYGEVLGLTRDILLTAAWALNITVAEWLIRRSARAARTRPALVKRSRALV